MNEKLKKTLIGVGVAVAGAALIKVCPLWETTIPCIVSFVAGAAALKLWQTKAQEK